MNNGEIVFDDCRVPEDHLLARGDALGKAGVYFRPGKIIQAAKNLGIGIAAFGDTAAFVQQRVQGGRILIKHQAVALRIAAMATKLEAVSALLQRAARAVDENHPDAARLCDMVKVFTSQEILQVCQHAVELHGGYGALLEAGVEKYLRKPCTCTWTQPPTYQTSRSPKRCSPPPPGPTPARSESPGTRPGVRALQ